MNNTERGQMTREIFSRELSNYERESMQTLSDCTRREVVNMINNLQVNEQSFKALLAMKYLINSINE